MTLFHLIEGTVYHAAEWIKLFIECVGVVIITWGVLISLWRYAGRVFNGQDHAYIPLRTSLAGYLILGLEFQLASDIISTAIAPDWNEIGKLAAIAVIRTVLNYFLERELKMLNMEDVEDMKA